MKSNLIGDYNEAEEGLLLQKNYDFLKQGALDWMWRHFQAHGDVVSVRMRGEEQFLLFHPRAVHHVLVTRGKSYSKQTNIYKKLSLLFGQGLVTDEGSSWVEQRRVVQPMFKKRLMEDYVSIMEQQTIKKLHQVERKEGIRQGKLLDVYDMTSKITLQIAGQIFFATDFTDREDEIFEHTAFFLENYNLINSSFFSFSHYLPTLRNFRILSRMRRFQKLLQETLEPTRLQTSENYISSLMSHYVGEQSEKTLEEKIGHIITMLMATHETSSNALAFIIYLLATNPSKMKELLEEIDTFAEEPLCMETLVHHRYLKQVIYEGLRLFPPIWGVTRRAEKDDCIDGTPIKKGTTVYLSTYITHRHPGFWKQPHRFLPERFHREVVKRKEAQHPFWRSTYFPFHIGGRRCIGEHFGMVELQTVLILLLRRYRFQATEQTVCQLLASVTLRPKGGLHLFVKKREHKESLL